MSDLKEKLKLMTTHPLITLSELEAARRTAKDTVTRLDNVIEEYRAQMSIKTIDMSSMKCNCNGPIAGDGMGGTKVHHAPDCNLYEPPVAATESSSS